MYAPAKVNICLHVLGRRADGYHELAMLMQRISLADRLQIRLEARGEIRTVCPGLELAVDEENIASKAARLLLENAGLSRGVAIEIDKQIPVAAGLGGGSSNAATVLRTLHDMLELNMGEEELMRLGLQLGADVPFFLFGRTAWATGIGERLEPWPGMPPHWLVLVNPGIPVSTAAVYQNLRLTGPRPVVKLPRFPEGVEALLCLLHNDLETVTLERYPVVAEVKSQLLSSGALAALMSGSGPTVFGLFAEQHTAAVAADWLAGRYGWWTRTVSPL
ncbi:MAG: 4-(cytidine 5'-diphospho)-2-C-methyl-D-erythritol kinase [Desulfuromonadales bacterium]|nr:4-(cytidine 5'-diphospho)-2-C-methyl-D-erythritol kinase [Desulfuromonadales bacterium]